MLSALVLSASLGAAFFSVDEGFTIAPHRQTEDSLLLDGPFDSGDVLYGYYLERPLDWSSAEDLRLNVRWIGDHPNVLFYVTLLDENDQTIGTYSGATSSIGNDFSLLPLSLTESGTGDATRLSGLGISWGGAGGEQSSMEIQSLVGLEAPIQPVITFVGYVDGSFTMTWSGTGTLPVNIERRESLIEDTWITVAQGVADGQYTDALPPPRQAFYRVVVP
jgi:hypothetical protein